MAILRLFAASLLTAGLLCAQKAPEAPPASEATPAAPEYAPWSAKFRVQGGLTSVDGVRNGLSVALNHATPLGEGWFNADLGYQEFFGSNYTVPIPSNIYGLSNNNGVDQRTTSVYGWAARLGYQEVFAENWTWQAGLSLNYFTVHNQAFAQFGYFSGSLSWNQSISRNRFSFSPFAGVRKDLKRHRALEFNLLRASYKEDTIYPNYAATPLTAGYGIRTVNTFKLEFAYVSKF